MKSILESEVMVLMLYAYSCGNLDTMKVMTKQTEDFEISKVYEDFKKKIAERAND